MNNQLVAFALSLAATQLPAMTVTIDHASPAAEEDFIHLLPGGAVEKVEKRD